MVDMRKVMQENLDTARAVLADPDEDLVNKDLAGARAAELWLALNKGPDED